MTVKTSSKRNSSPRPRPKLSARKVMAACDMCGSRVNEKQLKAHSRTCRGVIVRRRKIAEGEEEEEDERRERACPRCEKVLTCDRDFEMHMAVAHKFYWRLDFENEAEFNDWFREEGLDETMIAGPSKTHEDVHEKVFYCAINGGARMKVKCPCRLAVKRSAHGVVVRYSVLHNHAERFVRQQMSNECRDLILAMLKQGLRNYEILKTIKQTYPKSSMNYLVTSQAITRLRYRFHHMSKIAAKLEGKSPAAAANTSTAASAEAATAVAATPTTERTRRSVKLQDSGEGPAQRGVQFADFGEEKQADAAGVWAIPELQTIGMSDSYAEQEETLMD